MKLLPLVMVSVLGLTAAACGDDDESSASTDASAVVTEAPTASAAPDVTTAVTDAVTPATDSGGSDSVVPPSGDPIKIAVYIPLSGVAAFPATQNAAELAVADLNAKGGVMGRPVEADILDVSFTPDPALNAARMSLSEGIVAGFGMSATAQVQAVAPLFEDAGVPLIMTSATPSLDFSQFKSPILFRGLTSNAILPYAAIEYLVEELGASKVAIFNTSDEASVGSSDAAIAALQAKGLEPFTRQQFAPDSADLTTQVLEADGADAAINFGYPAPQTLVIRQMHQNGIQIPIVMDFGGLNQINLSAPEDLDDVYYTPGCVTSESPRPEAQAYREAFEAEYGDVAQDIYSASMYDIIHVWAAAAEGAGSVEPDAVTAFLSDEVQYEGVCGPFQADPENHNLSTTAAIASLEGAQDKFIEGYDALALAGS
jgi:branched-chain amino acid transport system substrate-binding protein